MLTHMLAKKTKYDGKMGLIMILYHLTCMVLTLAGTRHFAILHGTTGGGG